MDRIRTIFEAINDEWELDKVRSLVLELFSSVTIIGRVHPLGFYSFTLGGVDHRTNVRLHIWQGNAGQHDDLAIHDHIFNMKSLVLCGSLLNKTYELEKIENIAGTLYSVDYNEGKSTLSKIESGYKIEPVKEELITAGQFYSLGAGQFHESIKTSEDLAVTVVVTENVIMKKPVVFGRRDFGEYLEFDRQVVNDREYNSIRLKLSKALGGQ